MDPGTISFFGLVISFFNLVISFFNLIKGLLKKMWVGFQKLICRSVFEERDRLKEQLNLEKSMQWDSIECVFWKIIDGQKEGPFCPVCWQRNKLVVYLTPFRFDKKCKVCGCTVGDINSKVSQEQNDKAIKSIFDFNS